MVPQVSTMSAVRRQNSARPQIRAVNAGAGMDPYARNAGSWFRLSSAFSASSTPPSVLITASAGGPCPPPAAGSAQAKTSSPTARNPGSDVLDAAAQSLACMEKRFGYYQTEDACRLASGWLLFALVPSITAIESWQAKDRCQTSSSHPEDGGGEFDLGLSESSRGTSDRLIVL